MLGKSARFEQTHTEALGAALAALRFVLQPLYARVIVLALSRLGQNAYLICKAHVLNELYLSSEAAVKLLLGVDVRVIPQQGHVKILRQIFKHGA